jgi:hypothetical protein
VPQGRRENATVDVGQRFAAVRGGGRDDIGQAAKDLRQDDSGVATRAVQRAGGQRGSDLCDVVAVGFGVGLGPRRTHREQHVCPGIGVGNREHVKPIDLVGVRNEIADGGVCPVPQGGGVEPPSRHRNLPPDMPPSAPA